MARNSGDIDKAARLAKAFHGRAPDTMRAIPMPKIPKAVACIGYVSVIQYVSERDGKVYEFRHRFKESSRPHLCVTPDGKMCFMLGGAWTFTDDGFVDKA